MEFNYLVEKKRMLNSLGRIGGDCDAVACTMCPLSSHMNGYKVTCSHLERLNTLLKPPKSFASGLRNTHEKQEKMFC